MVFAAIWQLIADESKEKEWGNEVSSQGSKDFKGVNERETYGYQEEG